MITSNLRDRYISVTQCPGNDRGCVFDSKSLAKPLSISIGQSLRSTPFACSDVTFPGCTLQFEVGTIRKNGAVFFKLRSI